MAKPEAYFEKQIKNVAGIYGGAYIKIPDTKMINRKNRSIHKEEKRPFDGVLITPTHHFMVECKVNRKKLEPHQRENEILINNINPGSFIVLVKRFRKYSIAYQLYYNGKLYDEQKHLDLLLKRFLKKQNREQKA